jgi:hypothetical protein
MPVITCPDCGRDVSTLATSCPHCGRPSPAGTTPIAGTGAPPLVEEKLWQGTPSWRLLAGKIAGLVAAVVIIPLIAHFVSVTSTDPVKAADLARAGWWLTALVATVQIVFILAALARIRSTLYTITNQRVMIESGMLTRRVGEIDLRYIDDTQFVQRFSDRLLGIGDVTMVSSDKSLPVYVLRGILDPRSLREMIRANAYQVSQRQIFTRAT